MTSTSSPAWSTVRPRTGSSVPSRLTMLIQASSSERRGRRSPCRRPATPAATWNRRSPLGPVPEPHPQRPRLRLDDPHRDAGPLGHRRHQAGLHDHRERHDHDTTIP